MKTSRGELNGLAVCAGIGGLELGVHIALGESYRTVCYVEREAYAAATLVARMEDKALDKAPVWDDIKTFRGGPWRGCVDILTGGYPCQPFSVAGKRRGADDPRHLWPDVARITREVRPRIVFLENVGGHLRLGAREVIRDLHGMGYEVACGLFTAAEVGAPHRRERLFIVGNADIEGLEGWRNGGQSGSEGRESSERPVEHPSRNYFPPGPDDRAGWSELLEKFPALEPAIRRASDGTAHRVDRLRCLGNAVVPVCAAMAFVSLWRELRDVEF